MLPILHDIDPRKETAEREQIIKDFMSIFPDLRYIKETHQLIDSSTGHVCFIGMDFDLKEIYKAMECAERKKQYVTILCEDWQAPYYHALNDMWKTSPLFVEQDNEKSDSQGAYGLETKEYSFEPRTQFRSAT